ncbi:hypothetical protein NFI96_009768 [Prochilodus magdalenae]|nr:hypothetical protein NFI96_009768 [Prochilodus magdalenae]
MNFGERRSRVDWKGSRDGLVKKKRVTGLSLTEGDTLLRGAVGYSQRGSEENEPMDKKPVKPERVTWSYSKAGSSDQTVSNDAGSYRGRVRTFDQTGSRNLSLLISDLTRNDTGGYTCTSNQHTSRVELQVKGHVTLHWGHGGVTGRTQRGHRGDTEGTQRGHRGDTEGTRRGHRGDTEGTQRGHGGDTEGTQRGHRGDTEGTQRGHRGDTEGTWRGHGGDTEGTQRGHRGDTEGTQRGHRGDTEGTQRGHRGDTEGTQRGHRGDTEGTQRGHGVLHGGDTEGTQRGHREDTEGTQRGHRGDTEGTRGGHGKRCCALVENKQTATVSRSSGESVLLSCTCTDPPEDTPVTVQWRGPHQEDLLQRSGVQTFTKTSPGNLSVLISDLTVEDGGTYSCWINQNQYRTFTLTVKDCTLSQTQEKPITRYPGQSVLLPCSCTDPNTRPGSVKWERVDSGGTEGSSKEVIYSDRVQMFNKIHPSNLSLLISDLADQDQGTYRCSINNKQSINIRLSITDCTLSQTQENQITRYPGESVLLPCSCTDTKTRPLSVKWEMGGTEVSSSTALYSGRVQMFNKIHPSNLSLLISNLTEQDQGTYRCSTNNNQSISIRLSITATTGDIQRAVVSSMSPPVSAAPSADGCTTQDYMHTDRYHDCP